MSFIETIISMSRNRSDMSSMMVGSVLSFIGCILLMVPGILSDFIGILLQISVLDTLVLKIFMKNKKQKKYEDENIIDIEIEDDFQIRK